MSGMGSVLQLTNPTVVAAFRAALLHQGIIALLIFFLLALVWVSAREWVPSSRTGGASSAAAAPAAEPPARRVLRIGFGILWIFDGILQAQQSMPLGLPSQVIQPAAATSPGWVQHIVNWGVRGWTYHPVERRGGGRLDPDRDWRLAADRGPGPLVPPGRAGQRRLGPDHLGLR